MSDCICGSGKTSEKCCLRFLDGHEQAKTAEQLMRSRYTAYALGGYGEYLLDSWFPATSAGLNPLKLSEKTQQWTKLDVLTKSQSGDDATVEFKAYFHSMDAKDAKDAEENVLHEHSVFKRVAGRWLYVGGEVTG